MTPLRILHSEAATGFGGQEQYIFRMMCAMREYGHHMEAACQPHAQLTQRLRDEGFTVHTLYMDGPLNYVRGVGRLAGILARGRFDVVNTHSRRDTLLVGLAARLARVPLIVRTRHLAKKIGSLLSFTVIPHRVMTTSDYVRELVLLRGVASEKVQRVYPSIPYGPEPASVRHVLRAELGLSEEDVLVGCVAVMRAEKGHRDLLEAMRPLIQADEHVHLVLVGGGSPGFEQIQSLVLDRGLDKNVHMLGTRLDVPVLLPGMDIFALATHMEAAGMVFAEAGAAGVPVIGTRVGGVPEMMQEDRSGLLVPVGDVEALRGALGALITDPALRRRLGAQGRQYCRGDDRFDARTMALRATSVYAAWLVQRRG